MEPSRREHRPKVGASRDAKATGLLVLLVWNTELFVMLLTLWMPGQKNLPSDKKRVVLKGHSLGTTPMEKDALSEFLQDETWSQRLTSVSKYPLNGVSTYWNGS